MFYIDNVSEEDSTVSFSISLLIRLKMLKSRENVNQGQLMKIKKSKTEFVNGFTKYDVV